MVLPNRGGVNSSPAISTDGTVYVGSDDGKIYALRSTSLGLADSDWPKYLKDNRNNGSSFNPGCPVAMVASDTFYVEPGESIVLDGSASFDPDGDALFFHWTVKEKPDGASIIFSDSTTAITNVDFDEKNHGIYNISLIVTDQKDGTTFTSVVVYYGSLKWSYQTLKRVSSSPAIGSNGTIYVGLNGYPYGGLTALNANGSFKWNFITGGYVSSSPAIDSDGTLYFGSTNKKLYALNSDGTLKWKYQTGDDITSSPAIGVDGTVYVGSQDNKLYALYALTDL